MLINGVPGDYISILDRGLQYGDGVFRTMRVRDGAVLYWPRHYHKLQHDCTALGLPCPELGVLSEELQQLSQSQANGIAKIIVTRGIGARGYAPPLQATATRIVSMASATDYPEDFYRRGVKAHVCELRLSHQPRLAGIKHLNRLENVLAAAELAATDAAEGILLDVAGNVVEGTRSNLFMARNGALLTPDLAFSGVAGMQRERVMEWAGRHGVSCRVERFGLAELLGADEIFLVNSVAGLWPVRELQGHRWEEFPLARQIQDWLNNAHD